jgi:hypothetical protein
MAVTFTRTRQTYDATTGHSTPTVTTISGNAVGVRGNLQRYQALSLTLATAVTLLIVAEDYGLAAFTSDFVQAGDVAAWGGLDYTVRDCDPIAPDGVVIAARVIITR